MSDKIQTYGGQAVIEGVMMRGARAVAIAMRAPNKEIEIHTEELGKIYNSKLIKIPFLRVVTRAFSHVFCPPLFPLFI